MPAAAVAGKVGDAIAATVAALAFSGATVVRRKTPSLPQGSSPLEIVVSIGEGKVEPMTARKDFVTRPVAVTVVSATGRQLADDDGFRLMLEQIRATVNTRGCFTAIAEFDQVDVSNESPYDPTALAKDLNYGVELFSVRTIEARS